MPDEFREVYCRCDGWADRIGRIKSPLGEKFEYCPWCGKKLYVRTFKPKKNQNVIKLSVHF